MPKEMKTYIHTKTCIQMFRAAKFIIGKKWKQSKFPSVDEWIKKMCYMHITEYHLAVKRTEVLIHAATWMNVKNIMLSERSQSQKITYCMIPFILNIQYRQIHRDNK
uniref:DUF1725 domain-containing protein n=1 Tax=Equus caballus TaxID=9796 RepID=A0A9L0SD01_HORSE